MSKYTTLQINTTPDWKRWTKNKKWHRRKSPQGGWGMGSKEPIQKLFLLPAVTILANWYDASWFLYRMKSRAYKVRKLKTSVKKGDPWGDWGAQKSFLSSSSSFFLLYLLKTSKLITVKYVQKYFESTFGWTHFLCKNSKLKLVFKASFPWDLGLLLGQPIWNT